MNARMFVSPLAALLAVLGLASQALAQPVPIDVKSIVTYVFRPQTDGSITDEFVPNGTGFFVGVANPDKSKDQAFLYLVTAKHVLTMEDQKTLYKAVALRLNTKDGKSELVYLPVVNEPAKRNVFLHSDPSVDLAVIPVKVDQARYDFKWLPDDAITSKADVSARRIAEGSEVFFTGLFSHYLGNEKNYPIVRFGRVALMTEERINWINGLKVQIYLIESASYGGNSGSPVFFYLGPDRGDGGLVVGARELRLAGVMQGTFNDVQPVVVVETRQTLVSKSSNGIAAVVPAYKLREILFNAELKTLRGF